MGEIVVVVVAIVIKIVLLQHQQGPIAIMKYAYFDDKQPDAFKYTSTREIIKSIKMTQSMNNIRIPQWGYLHIFLYIIY